MKKIIRLTEADLHAIIKNAVKKVLRESVPLGKYDGQNFNIPDSMVPDRQYSRKKAEELASWDAYDKASEKQPYNSKPIRDNGYWDDFEKPGLESDMYRSMGNPSQYDTLAEPEDNVRNNSGYGYHETPTRPKYASGRLAMAALNQDNDDRLYNSNGSVKYGAVPSMARDPKNFANNGIPRHDIGKMQGDRANAANSELDRIHRTNPNY